MSDFWDWFIALPDTSFVQVACIFLLGLLSGYLLFRLGFYLGSFRK